MKIFYDSYNNPFDAIKNGLIEHLEFSLSLNKNRVQYVDTWIALHGNSNLIEFVIKKTPQNLKLNREYHYLIFIQIMRDNVENLMLFS